MAKTLLALVPFTKAYKEANEAMFELNDVKGMQAEVARCRELKELLDQGLHDEALVGESALRTSVGTSCADLEAEPNPPVPPPAPRATLHRNDGRHDDGLPRF